ncbi:MAG TPA: cyanophycinase [Bacteroidales bacterium]|nr:cyanophycinase [Bacteroidales bacterium]
MKPLVPNGKLILIGGKEARKPENKVSDNNEQKADFDNGVLMEILKEVDENPVIEVIPMASEDQEEVGKMYIDTFAKLNQKANVIFMNNSKDANNPAFVERIEKADIVFLTGGDQKKLFKYLHESAVLKTIIQRYEYEDLVIVGTSSGAMVMGEHMIIAGESDEAVLKGLIDTEDAFNIIPNVVIDTHFLSRGRFSRLAEALLINNDDIGIGICEDTGVVITEGNKLRTIGSGTVVLMEGSNIKSSNYLYAKDKDPLFIENLTIHVLAQGAGYDLQRRKFAVLEKKMQVVH